MGEKGDKPRPNGRQGNMKVRTGCHTCKVRKVKCDEEKPYCRRCTVTGRKCDGYPILPETIRLHEGKYPVFKKNLLPFKWRSNDESHAFEFFRTISAPALGGQSSHPFFTYIIPQLCYHEEAVRAAILALSTSHEQFMKPKHYIVSGRHQHLKHFALQQYSHSISLLVQFMGKQTRHELVLILCMCYIVVELLRGETHRFFLHIHQGLSLLASNSGRYIVKHSKVLTSWIIPMFWHLNYVDLLFGHRPRIASCGINGTVSSSSATHIKTVLAENLKQTVSKFEALQELESFRAAHSTFIEVGDLVLELLWRKDNAEKLQFTALEYKELVKDQQALQSCLDKWLLPFTQLQLNVGSSGGVTSNNLVASVLHMHYLILSIVLATALSTSETSYDTHMSSFLSITALAAPLIAAKPVTMGGYTNHPFATEMNIIAALYFTATKCRFPHVRNTAMSLMRSARQHPRTSRGVLMLQIAERIVELEEEQSHPAKGFPLVPNENQRICRIAIEHEPEVDDRHSKHIVSFFCHTGDDGSGEVMIKQETFLVEREQSMNVKDPPLSPPKT